MRNIWFLFSILFAVLFLPTLVFAMDLTVLTPYLIDWARKNPKVASVIIFMGMARVYMKPLQIFIRRVVLLTPTKYDDTLIEKLEKKMWFKILAYILDWLMSVKIESKKKVVKQVGD